MTFGKLLRKARDERGWKQKWIANQLGEAEAANYNQVEQGKRSISDEKLQILSNLYELDYDKLKAISASWEEPMAANLLIREYFPSYSEESQGSRPEIIETFDRVPLFGCAVPAGFPNVGDSFVEGYEFMPTGALKHPKDCFALRVKGDSMKDAGILEGDKIIVDMAAETRSGDIVVACFEGEFTVKRLKKQKDKIWLMPENSAYEPIDVTNKLDCCYKVVHMMRDINKKR